MAALSRPSDSAVAVALVYGLMLATVGWWPTHVDSGLALADLSVVRVAAHLVAVQPVQVVAATEVLANVLLFLPVGVFIALGWRRAIALDAVLVAAVISLAIETVQWLAPIDRTASIMDLLANAAGGLLGYAAIRTAESHPRAGATVLGGLVLVIVGVLAVLVWGMALGRY